MKSILPISMGLFSSSLWAAKDCPEYLKRFRIPFSNIEKTLVVPQQISELLPRMDNKFRGTLFRIEGLGRIYKKLHGKDFEELRFRWKEFEDVLGKYGEKNEFLDFGKKMGAEPKAIQALEDKADEFQGLLENYLKIKFWPGPLALESLKSEVEWIEEFDIPSSKKDREKAGEYIVDELKELEELDFDLDELELGLHKMRRAIRWILIEIQATNGLFQFTDETKGLEIKDYLPLTKMPIAKKDWNIIEANPAIKKPIYIPRSYFLALSKAVDDLGDIKTNAQNIEALVAAYVIAGHSPDEAEELVKELVTPKMKIVDWKKEGRRIRKELLKSGVIEALRKFIEDQI